MSHLMKNFLLYPLCLSMMCCGVGDNDSGKFDNFHSKLEQFFEKYKGDGDTIKKVYKVTPALLGLKKIISADENFNKNENSSLIVKVLKDPSEENILELLNDDSAPKNCVSYFKKNYSEIYDALENKNTFVRVKDGKIVDKTAEFSDKFVRFSEEDVQKYRGKILKDQSDSDDNTISITDLVNQYFEEKNILLNKHAKYLVCYFDKFDSKKICLNDDEFKEAKITLVGNAVLKFSCCFTNIPGQYNQESNFFSKSIPHYIKDLDWEKFGKIDHKLIALFEIIKVSSKKIKNLEGNE